MPLNFQLDSGELSNELYLLKRRLDNYMREAWSNLSDDQQTQLMRLSADIYHARNTLNEIMLKEEEER